MKSRHRHFPAFKMKVALEALKEDKTSTELVSQYQVLPGQIRSWKTHATTHLQDLMAEAIEYWCGIVDRFSHTFFEFF